MRSSVFEQKECAHHVRQFFSQWVFVFLISYAMNDGHKCWREQPMFCYDLLSASGKSVVKWEWLISVKAGCKCVKRNAWNCSISARSSIDTHIHACEQMIDNNTIERLIYSPNFQIPSDARTSLVTSTMNSSNGAQLFLLFWFHCVCLSYCLLISCFSIHYFVRAARIAVSVLYESVCVYWNIQRRAWLYTRTFRVTSNRCWLTTHT